LFLVRLAQGLLHMGKGLLTLSPVMSDGFTLNRAAMAGILTLVHSGLDMAHTLLGRRHYLLFSLVTAMRPRWLYTVNEQLEQVKVQVRVGTRVDIVGQAGKPKAITGFQQHTTPSLLSLHFAFAHTQPVIITNNGLFRFFDSIRQEGSRPEPPFHPPLLLDPALSASQLFHDDSRGPLSSPRVSGR